MALSAGWTPHSTDWASSSANPQTRPSISQRCSGRSVKNSQVLPATNSPLQRLRALLVYYNVCISLWGMLLHVEDLRCFPPFDPFPRIGSLTLATHTCWKASFDPYFDVIVGSQLWS